VPRSARRTSQKPAPNLPYGQGEQQAQNLKVVPMPSTRYEEDPGALPAAPQPQGQTQAPSRQQSMAEAMMAAQAFRFPNGGAGLLQGTQRPGEPVTHGLSVGPGAGPDILRNPTGTSATLFEQLAIATGDPWFRELARKAGLG
jgi:hypothetical protein